MDSEQRTANSGQKDYRLNSFNYRKVATSESLIKDMSHRIYVASSWRNEYFPVVVQARAQLSHPMAVKQLANDLDALRWCDTCVLVLPCGRSAHTEAGWPGRASAWWSISPRHRSLS